MISLVVYFAVTLFFQENKNEKKGKEIYANFNVCTLQSFINIFDLYLCYTISYVLYINFPMAVGEF